MVFVFPVITVMRTITIDPSSSVIIPQAVEGLKNYSTVTNDVNNPIIFKIQLSCQFMQRT